MRTRTIIEHLCHVACPDGRLRDHLAATSFYRDPASTRYHRCYEGGLADHSLGVFVYLLRLCGAKRDFCTLARVALCHDLCKVGRYVQVAKSEKVKNPDGSFMVNGYGKPVWKDVIGFEYAPARDLVLGHGDSSLFLAQRVLGSLDPAEAMAIRWHMGAYGTAPGEEMTRLSDAMAADPLVILAQAADLLDTYQGAPAADLERIATDELTAAGILPVEEGMP